jgi:hypothetical protein
MAEKEKEEWGETVKVVATDNSDEWGETVVVDPKSPAPSMKGGESGALVRPLTPTSASEGSESESWTQTVNPFADKGAVKPTQQAGAAQAPKAKLLKVIPSSEKKSPELLKARVDTYGDMYKRAMDRAYTLKQSVEGVDNELKNSKAYVDSNPNDQNAINSYNALISKRNEMAEMARMEISRADAWQKGIEKTQLEIDESLTASESISNSISNMATQIKGFLPASGLAISTLQNKIQQGAMYVTGKLMGYDDETASRVSTELSQNLPSAGILGTTQKEARQFYTERLGELEKEQKPTKSIIKTFEEGDVAGLGAAILDGGSSVISSVITSAPTGGVGIFTEMMGRSVYDFNNEKAKRLKISVDELYDRGLDEAAVPLTIGAVSASLEKIGLDGISKAINKKIGSKAVKDIFEIVLEGSKEAGTEWLQTGAEEYNKAIARGMNAEQAGEAALSKMLSEEGREAALKGAAGSGVSIATGRAAKSLYSISKSNRDKLYQDLAKVETLARERANPNLSSEALASIDREINNTTANMQKEVLDQLNRRANLTEENASLVEGIEANVKTISDDIESKKLLSEDPSLSDDAKIIIDLEIADLEAKRLDLAAQSEEIIKNNRPVTLTKNTSPTDEKYGTINRNDGKGVVDLTKEEYEAEQAKMQPKVDEQVAPTAQGEQVPKTKEEVTPQAGSVEAAPIENPKVAELEAARENAVKTSRDFSSALLQHLGITENSDNAGVAYLLPNKFKGSKIYKDNEQKINESLKSFGFNSVEDFDSIELIPTEYKGKVGLQISGQKSKTNQSFSFGNIDVKSNSTIQDLAIKSDQAYENFVKIEKSQSSDVNIQQPMGESKVDDGAVGDVAKEDGGKAGSVGVVEDAEYNDFIDKGKVSEARLNDIANKVKNQEPLSDREKEIFSDKTSEINKIIANQAGSVGVEGDVERIEIPRYFTFGELGGGKGKSGKALSSLEADKNNEIQENLKKQLQEGDKLIEPNGTVTYFRNGKVVKSDGSLYGMADIPAFVNGVTIERSKQSLKETPTTEEKVSGGLTQEEKTNLENISKDAGVNFQEVRNVYNKYGDGKPLNEITLEDYQKAEEKRQGGKEKEAVEEKEEASPKEKLFSKVRAYNNLSKRERSDMFGNKLRSDIMSDAAAIKYTIRPTKSGNYILIDDRGKQVRAIGIPRSKDVIQEEKRTKERRSRAKRELPLSIKHSVAQDIANGVKFNRKELKDVTGWDDADIPFWLTVNEGGVSLEFYNVRFQEKGGFLVEDDMNFVSDVADAIRDFAFNKGRTAALEFIEKQQEIIENGGFTDAELQEQMEYYQAKLDEENFDYFAEYLSNLSDEEAQLLSDELREAEKENDKLLINEILNENEDQRKTEQGEQDANIEALDIEREGKEREAKIAEIEENIKNLQNSVAKKQRQADKLSKEAQGDVFRGTKAQMFDAGEELRQLTKDIREQNAEIERQKEKLAELKEKQIQPSNQLKIQENAKKQQSGQMREQGVQDQPQRKGDSDMPIINEAELQDGETVEEEVEEEGLPKLTKEQQIEAERRSLNEPKNVSDLAKIFNKILGLSPKESVMAARLFDVKAKNMSELLGITKDEYYQRYWFTGEQEGGLSQMTLPDGRKVTVKSVSAEVVNGFYSNTENALGQVKQEKMSGNQWATQLLSRGANKEEMQWTGLEAFLKENAAKPISKADIQQFLKDNRIQVVEVVKSDDKIENNYSIRQDDDVFDVMKNGVYSKKSFGTIEEAEAYINSQEPEIKENTKFSQYQLEGEKKNYKEVLVTMPSKETEEGLPEGYKIIKKEDYKGAWEGTENFVIVDYDGYSVMQGKTEKEALSSFNKLRKGTTPDKNAKFKSTHFSEPNILVHLRMNTRTDAEGNKVLFLEEVQSDWGQKGKKEGFKEDRKNDWSIKKLENDKWDYEVTDPNGKKLKVSKAPNETEQDVLNRVSDNQARANFLNDKGVPTAPFVMDTNAWTKLGLKVALKEAVKQGADKIAWTTGEQQNERYDLSKQVDEITYSKYPDGTYQFSGSKNNNQIFNYQRIPESKLEDYVGKEVAKKIIDGEGDVMSYGNKEEGTYGELGKTLSGVDLKVGGKGMKGFYGSPTEGSLGIVGNVAKSLFKQEPKTIELDIKDYDKFTVEVFDEDGDRAVWTFDNKDKAKDFAEMKGGNIVPKKDKKQHSIDITPELKAQVQEGLPLFQDRRGAWSKIAASAKRIISMYDKARLDTAVHEILGHDFLDEIISLSATNKEFEQDLNTIIDEYIKSSGNKTSKATLLNELKNFNVESNNQSVNARAIHEWFSRTAEGYFMGETNIKPDSKLAKMFEQFRQYLTDLFNTMTSRNYIIPSEPMKQIFRKAFGAENFDFVNDYAEANIMEGKLDVLRITENEIPQSRLDKFKKLREAKRGLGQEEDVDIDELVDAARYLSTDPTVNVFNVVDELVSMYPQKEEYIRKHSKTFEKVFVAEGKKVRETARSVYESDVVSPEMKQRAATIEDLFSYTPEKLQEKMEDVESLIADYSIDDLMAFFATSNEIPFKEYPLFLAAMQKRISRAINELNNSNQGQSAAKQKLLNYEMTIMDRYIAEGTATGQRLNYFKVLKNMSTDGKLRFFKRKFKEESGNAVKEFQDLISNLRKERDKAYKDNDYFLEENLSLEQRIEDLEAELAKERSTKVKNDKRKDRESLSQAKPPKRKISQSELNDILKELGSAGLGQSLEDLNAALKLGFYIIQDKPKTIEQFTKDWNKITKQNKTQEELSQVYRDVRKYATENEGVDIDYFDSDAMIQSSIDSFNDRASQKKNLAKKELDSDIAKAEKEAMKTQMSEKDKEVKAKEALKKREKEIVSDFLNSLGQDGLWQKYVQSNAGKIVGNLASKIGGKPSEKALLDKFITLATNEINSAINELTPNQKAKKTTPNYAQQLGDLISNQDKVAEVFDKAVKEFAEKYANDVNAQALLSKLNGLKNPFSEGLLGKALEAEAQKLKQKIGDYAFKYAGVKSIARRQFVGEILKDSELQGAEFDQLKQDLYDKFNAIIAETETDVAGQLAKAILSNAKKELGLGKKQQDYVKELLGYLKNKAKDYYKTTNKQALVDPFEQLKYAVEMLNDANGRKIWDDSKAELIAKIDSDKDLSQQEKDDLKAYLDDYQNAIFDQLLSKNKLFNNVKKVLAEESPFVKKDGSVDWNGIIIQAKGNVEIAKQIILDSVADKLQGYSGSQVNSVIDAIGREYQRRIDEKRAEIIEKQLKDISDKKVIFKKKIATGFVQKLVEMENSGALGDQRFEQALKEWIGFSDMTPDKWSRLRELIVDAEEAPEGNERDRAIENLSAYIKFNKIGKFAEIYASAYYAGLLARPTTIIKNSTGIIEPLLTLFYKSFTDRNYARAMIQGLKRGDAADIWGGGLVQGGKLDEETGNDGLPRVNMLKQWRRQEKGIIPKLFALGAKPLDLLSMADALSQAMVERGAEYEFYARYLLEKNKEDIRNGVQGVVPITEKEARKIAIKRLSDDAMLDWAFAQAEDEFASRKIVPSSARLNRRAYEIVSESLLPTSVRELAQNLALEESYKSKLISFRGMTSQTRAQKRLETNYGVATFIGSFAKGLVDLLAEGGGYVAGGATKVLPVTEARRNQIRNSVERAISMRVLPFARGISNVVEKSLEKTPYGIVSGVIGATAEKLSYGKPKTIDEILQHQYMMNRNKAKIAKSATSMIIGSAIYYTLLSASKEWDDEEEKEERYYLPTGFYSAGETVRFGKNKIERYTLPVNCVVLYGRIIPLSLFGTVGIGSMITAQAYDNFLSKEKKKQGAVVDPDNPESIKGFSSFVSSSGNAILNMSAMQSISELQESVSSKGTMDFGDYASKLSVKSIALPIPFSGTANQIIQGARYLSGDKTAQAAIGADEKIYKELGLAGIVYNRPVLDWRGRPVNAVLQNQEGIASFVSMLDKRPLDKIDMYLLKELEFNPVIDKRLSENFADLNMIGMSKDEYYDYTKNVGMTANNYIEAYFDTIKNYQIPQYKIDELAAEGKNETDLKKQLKTIKKTFVSDFLNIAEQKHMLNYQFSKGIIKETYEAKFKANNDRLENLIEKINDKGK